MSISDAEIIAQRCSVLSGVEVYLLLPGGNPLHPIRQGTVLMYGMVWGLTVKDCRGDFFGGMWAWGVMGGLRNHDLGTPPPLGGPNTWGQVNHNQAQKGSKNFLRLRWGLENSFSLDVCNFKTLHAWMEQPHRIWTPTPCRAIGCQNSRDYVRCKLLIFFCISCVFLAKKT